MAKAGDTLEPVASELKLLGASILEDLQEPLKDATQFITQTVFPAIKKTIDFIKEMQFASMHIFPYSRRKNTKADSLDGHLNPAVIHNRASIMIETAKVLKQKYESNFLNKTVSVLIETTKKGYYIGHSSNYLEVYVKSDIDLTNKFCDVLITSIENDIMKGEVVCVL